MRCDAAGPDGLGVVVAGPARPRPRADRGPRHHRRRPRRRPSLRRPRARPRRAARRMPWSPRTTWPSTPGSSPPNGPAPTERPPDAPGLCTLALARALHPGRERGLLAGRVHGRRRHRPARGPPRPGRRPGHRRLLGHAARRHPGRAAAVAPPEAPLRHPLNRARHRCRRHGPGRCHTPVAPCGHGNRDRPGCPAPTDRRPTSLAKGSTRVPASRSPTRPIRRGRPARAHRPRPVRRRGRRSRATRPRGRPRVLVARGDTCRPSSPTPLVVAALTGDEPVLGLLGFTAPPEWWAVGVVTGARARSLDGSAAVDGATFAHLVDRAGSSVSLLSGAGPDPWSAVRAPSPARAGSPTPAGVCSVSPPRHRRAT